MKFTLIFLIFCFCMLTTSYGQNQFYWPFFYSGHQQPMRADGDLTRRSGAFWPAKSYYSGLFGPSYKNYINYQESASNNDDYDDSSFDDEEVVGRSKFRFPSKQKFGNKLNQQERLLMNGLAGKFLLNNRQGTTVTTFTTVYATTSTITNANVVNCIARAQFAAAVAAAPPACRRKREDSSSLLEIDPTPNTEQLETTVLADESFGKRDGRNLESSFDSLEHPLDETTNNNFGVSPRFGFLLFNSALYGGGGASPTTTVTITIPTSFLVSSTAITKNVVLGGNQALNCLPAGFSVC